MQVSIYLSGTHLEPRTHAFATQTQALSLRLDRNQSLDSGGSRDLGLEYLHGNWSIFDPATRRGLQMIRDVAQVMQPGFYLKERDDAVFYFVQERALMIAASSRDSGTLLENIPFEVGVGHIPIPEPEHPVYGQEFTGKPSEAESTGFHLGIVRYCRKPEVAVDFLRFLTSQPIHQRFVEMSGWHPAVVGVRPKKGTEPFAPFTEGMAPTYGFNLQGLGDLYNLRRLYLDYFHLLAEEDGSVDAFCTAFGREAEEAIIKDLRDSYVDRKGDTLVQDTLVAAYHHRFKEGPDRDAYWLKEREGLNRQVERESGLMYWEERPAAVGYAVE